MACKECLCIDCCSTECYCKSGYHCTAPVTNCPDFVPESTKQNCLCVSCATPCTQCDVCSEPITKCKSFTAKEN